MNETMNYNEPPEQTPQEQLTEELWLEQIHNKIKKEEKNANILRTRNTHRRTKTRPNKNQIPRKTHNETNHKTPME